MAVTLDQVQRLADQLTTLDKARLAAHLNAQLIQELAVSEGTAPAAEAASDAWTRLQAFRREIEAMGSAAPDFAAQLDEDRRTRAATLEGPGRVHP